MFRKELLICLLFVILSISLSSSIIDSTLPHKDGKQYFFMGYNLYKYGIISNNTKQPVQPTFKREPLYSTIIAGMLFLIDDQDKIENSCFLQKNACPKIIKLLKSINIIIIALIVFVGFWSSFYLSAQSLPAASITAIILSIHTGLMAYANTFSTEPISTLLVLLTSICFYMFFHKRNYLLWGILGGIALGLLALAKAIFFYVIIVFIVLSIPVLILYFIFKTQIWKKSLYLIISTAFIAGIIISPWLLRNYGLTDKLCISGRGDTILSIRAEYDTMPWSHVPTSFIYFTPLIGDKFVEKIYGKKFTNYFNRSNNNSYYYLAKKEEGSVNAYAKKMNISKNSAAINLIKKNWLKHIILTITFAYRGAFVPVGDYSFGYTVLKIISGIISIFFIPLFFLFMCISLFKRQIDRLFFIFPSLLVYGGLAFSTHFIPRYNIPMLGVYVVVMVTMIYELYNNLILKRKGIKSVKR